MCVYGGGRGGGWEGRGGGGEVGVSPLYAISTCLNKKECQLKFAEHYLMQQ